MSRQNRSGPMDQVFSAGRGMLGIRRFGYFFYFGNRANSEKLDLQNYV